MRPVRLSRTGLPGRHAGGVARGDRRGRRHGLLRLSRLHQRAQLSRPELRPQGDAPRASPTPTRAGGACWSRSTPFRAPATSGRGDARSTTPPNSARTRSFSPISACSTTPTRRHPGLRRHLSVQAAASNPLSIDFYRENFGISRVVLPRVLSVEEVAALIARMQVEAEVFAFGRLGTMVEGRCYPVLLHHRPLAEQRRRLRAGRIRLLPRGRRLHGVAARRGDDEPLREKRERRLSDAVQEPPRRSTARPPICSRSRSDSTPYRS